jgi:hypothetical protein
MLLTLFGTVHLAKHGVWLSEVHLEACRGRRALMGDLTEL